MRKLHFVCEMKSSASGEQQILAPEQAESGLAGKFFREGVLVDELTMNQQCALAAKKAISILEYIRCVASKQKEVIFHCSALVRYIWSARFSLGLPSTRKSQTYWSKLCTVSDVVEFPFKKDNQNPTGHGPGQTALVDPAWVWVKYLERFLPTPPILWFCEWKNLVIPLQKVSSLGAETLNAFIGVTWHQMSSCFHQKPSTFTTHQSCQGSKAPANGLMGKFCQYLLQGACSMLGLQALNTPYLRFVAWGTMVQSSERENSPPSGLQGSHCWCPGWKEEEEA